MKIDVLGANSALGVYLSKNLNADVNLINRNTIDFNRESTILEYAIQHDADLIINCIAYMPADKCEENELLSRKINFIGPSLLTQALQLKGTKIIHFSSDFVFGEESRGLIRDSDTPNPKSIYGKHKAELEDLIKNFIGSASIIRFAGLLGHTHKSSTFLEKIYNQYINKVNLRVICDVEATYSSSSLITEAILSPCVFSKPVSNVVLDGHLSWWDLAHTFMSHIDETVRIEKISYKDIPLAAPRNTRACLMASEWVKQLSNYSSVQDFLKEYASSF